MDLVRGRLARSLRGQETSSEAALEDRRLRRALRALLGNVKDIARPVCGDLAMLWVSPAEGSLTCRSMALLCELQMSVWPAALC